MKNQPHSRHPGYVPSGLLANRANLRRHYYDLKLQMKRLRRVTRKDANGNVIAVLHETKGWQSARIAV